jgi:hypothetical protein
MLEQIPDQMSNTISAEWSSKRKQSWHNSFALQFLGLAMSASTAPADAEVSPVEFLYMD